MTDMDRHLRAGRDEHSAAGPILVEYLLVLAVVIVIGAVIVAEATGMLNAFVHDISFLA